MKDMFMWQVNETLSFDGKPYRILLTETSYFYWIALDENKGLPEKIYFDECNHWVDEGRVERIPDPYDCENETSCKCANFEKRWLF